MPSVAAKESCKPTEAHEYGLIISKRRSEAESEVIPSRSRFISGAQMRKSCIIPALDTDGVKPVIAIKMSRTGMPSIA